MNMRSQHTNHKVQTQIKGLVPEFPQDEAFYFLKICPYGATVTIGVGVAVSVAVGAIVGATVTVVSVVLTGVSVVVLPHADNTIIIAIIAINNNKCFFITLLLFLLDCICLNKSFLPQKILFETVQQKNSGGPSDKVMPANQAGQIYEGARFVIKGGNVNI